jgi:hypothetical protein
MHAEHEAEPQVLAPPEEHVYPYSRSATEPNREVSRRLGRFRADLKVMQSVGIIRKYLTLGRSYVPGEDDEYRIKDAVSRHFGVHPDSVKVVGSAQLGFSIAPQKRYIPFHEKSDIDLAIISDLAFDRFWKLAEEYRVSAGQWENLSGFRKYLMSGWIRPDMLPRGDGFPATNEWLETMGELSTQIRGGAFKISAGIYRTHEFLEMYQLKSVESCRKLSELEQ